MNSSYVLITPARNEENFIEKTIRSVISQTTLPQKWMIINDNSTDGTNEIICSYAKKYDFIQVAQIEDMEHRSFASKVKAFEKGLQELIGFRYGYVGILDADLSFAEDYYENILRKFKNRNLGIAGGVRFVMINNKWVRELSNPWSVCAGVQLFRRECFEGIGGYTYVERMEDCLAEVMARMQDWEVQAFADARVFHHRQMGSTMGTNLQELFRYGTAEHSIGYHPLYEAARFFYRIKEKPYVIGSLMRFCGYFWAILKRNKKVMPEEIVKFLRAEQTARLFSYLPGLRRSHL